MATATKCMSKMNKKELYEHCKKLTNENQKLQLFVNTSEEKIEELENNWSNSCNNYCKEIEELKIKLIKVPKHSMNYQYMKELEKENEELKAQVGIHTEKYGGTMVFPSVYNKKKQKCKKLKKYIEELQEKIEQLQKERDKYFGYFNEKDYECECLRERMEKAETENEELKKDLEYFQNKCEIMEKELIEEEEKGDINFLKKYIVPNFYKPEHFGLKEEEVEDFKEFVRDWATGVWANDLQDTMEELLENFRKLKQEEEEEDFTLTFEEGNMPIVYNEEGVAIGELQEDGEVIMYSDEPPYLGD